MRARNIKPAFFRDAEILELPLEARYLFAGLWCLADRAGKLADKPKQIKVEVFGEALQCDCDGLLNLLVTQGLIVRYKIDEMKFIKVINFLKHQSPHHTEAQSKIPDPPEIHGESTVTHGESPETPVEIPPDSLIPGFSDSLKKDTPFFSKSSKRSAKKTKTLLPEDFGISDQVRMWAAEKGFNHLEDHLEAFKDQARARGYEYCDWDSAFKKAIRGNWAKLILDDGGNGNAAKSPTDPNCPHCHGLGLVEAEKEGIKGMADCTCRGKTT